ncbi:MAG: cation acetate symporter [Candidatus Eremiobacteraeota bacterium]|nr:cation acetate symporter [Candidatus Eremiobacteraeota bacterium]
MTPATIGMFLVFVAITLVVTAWAGTRMRTPRAFYSANRGITGFQNGWAVAGDYMSAASFLGISGLIAFYGFDGFMYSVGWFVAYLTVLLLVAEPLRNTGKYTMADVLSFRMHGRGVRGMAAISTLAISLLYMVAQMVGAGALAALLFPQVGFNLAIVCVGLLMLCYVVIGGMLATTWVQIIKATLLLCATALLSILVLRHYGFSLSTFFDAVAHVPHHPDPSGVVTGSENYLEPGRLYGGFWGPLNLISLGAALILGTAGLPHILMRFYTVPSAKAARTSVAWAMVIIGSFYIMTTFLGFGAAAIVGQEHIGVHVTGGPAIRYIAAHPNDAPALNAELVRHKFIVPVKNNNLAAPTLAQALGGDTFLAFIAAVAFATILAVVSGLTIAASSAFAHDIWLNIVRNGVTHEKEQLLVARITAICIGILSICIAIALKTLNVAFLVGLAFAVAASANVPVILLTLWWRRFNRIGAIAGMLAGLIASLGLIAVSPAIMGVDAPTAAVRHLIQSPPLFPLENPAIVSVPCALLVAVVFTLLRRDDVSETTFPQLTVRANTGLGAEV